MKIAIIGPGYGHNIKPYLDFFESNKEEYSLDFYYHTKDDHKKNYDNISFFNFKKRIIHFIFHIKKYDIIWLMGGGRLTYVISVIQLFKHHKALSLLNIWSEALPRKMNERTISGRLTGYFASRFSIINCNWYGTADIINVKYKHKVQVNPLGLINDYYEKVEPNDYISSLLENIKGDSYNFLYPKSFTSASRHDLVIEAAAIVKQKTNKSFKVYFLEGNVVDEKRKKFLFELIKENQLENDVLPIKTKRYLDTKEFNLLWTRIDCGLQIAENDQISNTVFEPLINEKEIIISDIAPYHYIKNFFDFELELTPLNKNDIAEKMLCLIDNKCSKAIQDKKEIAQKIKDKYSFNKNFNKILTRLESISKNI